MTLFWWLIVATLVVAAADWVAVATDRRSVEYALKPATMVVLIAAAIALADPANDAARWILVVGLVCSLAGDVFLMLDPKLFLAGLGAFLVGHVAYVVALAQFDLETAPLVIGGFVVVVAGSVIGRRIVDAAAERDERFRVPVSAYVAVISAMVIAAFGTTIPAAIAGALLFYASDGILGWNRFVQPIPQGRLAIMIPYHLGQVGLVIALLG